MPVNPEAVAPYGLALLDYFRGETAAQLIIRRDDGVEVSLPVSHFFRSEAEFSPIEVAALERCEGHVLDIGAGSGLHSLVMQSRGVTVTAIDIDRHAVEIMTRRGVRDVQCADIYRFQGDPFDTVSMLGHGIGMVEDLQGLSRFLAHARTFIRGNGQLLLHSIDVRQTDDPDNLAYHDANRRAGRYVGEIRLQFEYQGRPGPFCGWLHVDPQTLAGQAAQAGWECATILEQEGGDYLAGLTLQEPDCPIRPERAGDEDGIADVHTTAFGQPDEARLVAELRGAADPYVSLVAHEHERLVGHILFTPVTIRAESSISQALGLAPIAVLPEFQGRGIGSALTRAGLEACARGAHLVVFVLGEPGFYLRFGFRPAPPLGLRFRSPEFDPYFMVAELAPGALAARTGWVEYLPPFSNV